jgi:hypothetical protein
VTGHALMAVFVRRWQGERHGFGRPRYVAHLLVYRNDGVSFAEAARRQARRLFVRSIRSCDLVEARHDGGRRRWYGQRGAESPGGVGLV